MKLPSQMVAAGSHFGVTPSVRIERSKFDRSHALKTTFNAGLLVPFLVDEVLPGDTLNCRSSFFIRMSTPLKPVMDNLYWETFYFFVPNRLLWTHWEKFNGAQDNPGDSTSYTVPQIPIAAGGAVVGTLFDYFGIPSGSQITGGFNVNALHSRAYNFIWNEWFRDENQQNSLTFDTGDGPDTLANYTLQRRGKRFDYMTSCLPWPQKGSAVTIPAGATSAPVYGNGGSLGFMDGAGNHYGFGTTSGGLGLFTTGAYGSTLPGAHSSVQPTSLADLGVTSDETKSGLLADLSSAFATTMNQLRLAEQTQVLLERDARGGTRYTEILKSHFGVTSPDARLQRPEYLGGGSTQINFHPVPNTQASSGSTAATQQGNLAAFATASAKGHGFNKSFTEHGVIIALGCVRADLTYQEGLDRMWSRQTRYDYYWPSLAHIGEQSVLNKEIFVTGGSSQDNAVFGYQERYGEYRYKQSLITGQFRSDFATPLDVYHLAQRFTSLPVLGSTFISENPPVARVQAVTSEPQFFMDSFHDYKCARPLPVYGIPSLGGRL